VDGFNGGAQCGEDGRVATRVVERYSVGNGVVHECGVEHGAYRAGDGGGEGLCCRW
jgi:hypothetical protein